MADPFRTIIAGTPVPSDGQVLYVMRFPWRQDPAGIQRISPGSGYMPQFSDRREVILRHLQDAAKVASALEFPSATWHIDRKWYRAGPIGTILGVRTMRWTTAGVLGSMETWDLPPHTQTPNMWGITEKPLTIAHMLHYAPNGFIMEVEIRPAIRIRWHFREVTKSDGSPTVDVEAVQSTYSIPIARYYHSPRPQMWFFDMLRIYIKQSSDDLGPPTPPPDYMLYHTHEINCTITPPHQTPLMEGQTVYITAVPDNDRFLTDFTVQGEQTLPGSLRVPSADEQRLIDLGILDAPDPNSALYEYGPVTSDVYVGAEALGVDIEWELTAGVPATQQMTCDDCYTGEWSIGETDLPETATVSVSDTGLVSVYIPEDVYNGIPGGTAYIEVIFTGFSQTVSRVLRLTILPVPAFGTVWEGVALLDETPKDIIRLSDGNLFILGATKGWITDSDLTTFTEVLNDGSAMSGTFLSVVETANGSLVTSDRANLWVKAADSEVFVKTALTFPRNDRSSYVTGSTASDLVIVTQVGSIDDKINAKVFNVETLASIILHSSITRNLLAKEPGKGVVQSDGTFLIPANADGYTAVMKFAADGLTYVTSFSSTPAPTNDAQPIVYLTESGRAYILHSVAPISGQLNIVYSDDLGETWSDPIILPLGGRPLCGVSLKSGCAVWGHGNRLHRTTDNFTSSTQITTAIGTIYRFLLQSDRKILAVTSGDGSYNLWKSEA